MSFLGSGYVMGSSWFSWTVTLTKLLYPGPHSDVSSSTPAPTLRPPWHWLLLWEEGPSRAMMCSVPKASRPPEAGSLFQVPHVQTREPPPLLRRCKRPGSQQPPRCRPWLAGNDGKEGRGIEGRHG